MILAAQEHVARTTGGNGRHDAAKPAGYPSSWYLVCRSADVPRRKIISRDFLGQPIVMFRGRTGRVHALAAHCRHMGAHLGKGQVIDDCVRCPLHHWEWDGNGGCAVHPEARQSSLPVVERFGAVFAFNGPEPLFTPPSFAAAQEPEPRTAVGRPVEVACPWDALVMNGFDVQHFQTVHGRALREPAVVDNPCPWRIQLRYVSRVTGRRLADRAMKWLSADHIHVSITCWGGTVITVQSRVGRSRTHLMLGVLPAGPAATRVTPIFAVHGRGAFQGLRLAITRWLFRSFLIKDVSALENIRWSPRIDDVSEAQPLSQMIEFMRSLPRTPAPFAWQTTTPPQA